MKDYPMKLLSKAGVKLKGIVPNSINTYIDLSVYRLTRVGKAKSDYIGIIIVLQVLLINFQEIVIRTKYVVDVLELFSFFFEDSGDKGL